MQTNNAQVLSKQLSYLKMRVELIAWRIEEIGGMSPRIRAALPASTVDVFEDLLYSSDAPDPSLLMRFETAVQQAEEALAQDVSFWRTGNETLH